MPALGNEGYLTFLQTPNVITYQEAKGSLLDEFPDDYWVAVWKGQILTAPDFQLLSEKITEEFPERKQDVFTAQFRERPKH